MQKFIVGLLMLCVCAIGYAQEYDFLDERFERIAAKAFEGSIKLTAPAYLYDGTAIKKEDISDYLFRPELKISFFGVKEGAWKLKAIVFEKESPELIEQKRLRNNRRNGEDPLMNKLAPEVEAVDMAGESFKLSDFRGKLVVLNFWFIGCKPCIMEMPDLNDLVEEYENKEIVFLAFALDRASSINEFLKKEAFEYRIIPDGRAIASDYAVYSYPTHFIIDPSGKVVFSQTGYSTNLKSTLKNRINGLLK